MKIAIYFKGLRGKSRTNQKSGIRMEGEEADGEATSSKEITTKNQERRRGREETNGNPKGVVKDV